jgi:hypothetical protein
MDKPECYIGRKPCGCVVAVTCLGVADDELVARDVADFIRSGYAVEPMSIADMRKQLHRCKCGKPKAS